jgi:hypothetical protein
LRGRSRGSALPPLNCPDSERTEQPSIWPTCRERMSGKENGKIAGVVVARRGEGRGEREREVT